MSEGQPKGRTAPAPARTLPDEVEPNDTRVQAQPLTGASPIVVSGSAEVNDTGAEFYINYDTTAAYTPGTDDRLEDLFQVTTTAPGLTVTLDGFTADLDLYLINGAGTLILAQSNATGTTPEMIQQPSLAAGSYLIAVSIFEPAPINSASAYTLTVTATTSSDPPPPVPTGLTATGTSTEVTLSWSPVSAPDLDGYHVYRDTNPITTPAPGLRLTSTPQDPTTFADANVTTGVRYYYRVTAVDDAGNESALSNQADATPGDPPPPVPTGLTATGTSTEVTLSWSPVSAPDLDGYHVYRDINPFVTPAPGLRLTSAPQDPVTFADANVAPGVRYYYRVTAVDDAGNESVPSNQAEAVINTRPTTLEVLLTRSFGDSEEQANYRLLALPGEARASLASTLSGTSGENWRAFQEQGGTGDDPSSTVECEGSCSFAPGEGFWVLADAPWSFSDNSVPTATLSGTAYSVSVQAGWNIISNPLEEGVAWSSVQAANNLGSEPFYRWNRSWQPETGTFPTALGEAFYFFSASDGSLVIPFPFPTRPAPPPPPTLAERIAAAEATGGSFGLTLTARADGGAAAASVSAEPEAATGPDEHDRFAPPGTFERVGLAVIGGASASPRRLRHEARPAGAEGYHFELDLTAAPGTEVELLPDFVAGSALEAVLVNAVSEERHTLHPGVPVRVRSAALVSRYTLLVGSPAFVRAGRTLPAQLEIGGYPNPFHAAATLRYGLTEPSSVRLSVYDVLGRRVAVLLDGEEREPGYHTAVWAPGDLASGVYVYVFEAGARRLTGRVTLVR